MAKEPENKAVSSTNKTPSESPGSRGAGQPQGSADSGKTGKAEASEAAKDMDGGRAAKDGESGNGAEKDAAGQDAVALLKADHRKVEALFQQYASARNSNAKRRLVAQIAHEFLTHSLIEEKIFYPACREKIDDDDLDEAQVEHDSAKLMLLELREGSPGDPYYDAKVTVLGEYIKHHVAEEEKSPDGIFASARKAGVDLAALGKEISDRREEMARQVDEERQPAMPSLSREKGYERKEYAMAQQDYRDRDRGRSRYEDDDDRGRRMPPRDSEGRFMSEGGGGYRSSRDYDDDGDRGRGHGGWFGDPEGHSEASRRGWEHRESGRSGRYEDEDRGRSSSSRYDEEDNRGRRMPQRDSEGRFMSEGRGGGGYRSSREDEGRGRGHGGWFGDSEGHSEASRRGWEHREGGGYRSSGRDEDEHRGRYEDERGGRYSRGREDEDDRGRGHGGWFGDPRGHSEAARRGWQHR